MSYKGATTLYNYDSSVGAFVSEDPIKDGLNWYVYCGADPVNFVDPLGLAEFMPLGGHHEDMDVYLRDMFNMYKRSSNDKIDVYDDRVVVHLNNKTQTYYYNTRKNGSVHGNRMDGD